MAHTMAVTRTYMGNTIMRAIISRRGVFLGAFLALVILAGALTTTAAAQVTTPAAEDRLAKLEKDVA